MLSANSFKNQVLQFLKSKARRIKITPEFIRNTEFQGWAIIIILNITLAFLLTPDVHFSHPEYKVGSIATRDARADRDFLVEDRASIEQKRFEVIKDIQSVYDYDIDTPSQIKVNVANAFAVVARLYSQLSPSILPGENVPPATRQSHLKQLKKGFEDALGITLTEDEFHILHKYRFAPFISEKISKLVTTVYNSELITNVSFLKQDMDNGIIIRDIKTQEERDERSLHTIKHISKIDGLILKKAPMVLSSDDQDVRKLTLSLSRKLIQPNLTFNRNASERKKQTAVKDVKPVYFQVQKDEMIVHEGQKITISDMDKLEAYFMIRGEKRFSNLSILLGIFIMITALVVVLYFSARIWLKTERKIHDTLFLSVTTLLQIILVKMGIFMSEAFNRAFPFLSPEVCFYAIPFAVGSMLVGVLINQNIALVFSIFASFLVAFLFDSKIYITLFAFLASVVASYQVVHCKQRSAFFRIGLFLGLVNCGSIFFISLIQGDMTTINTLIKFIMGVTGGIISGIIIAGITPLFESFFDYTTDIKLLELANLNQPTFQQMIMEAPGTYHHSIVVASLVEAAAEAIGANSLLAKVSAYYHDIGKIKKPLYFIENQRNGENKHDRLSPKMSSLIIITHVKDGYELASKAKLGRQIMNVIREHHGTSLVSYFYEKSRKDRDHSIRSLPESDFRYAGPKPQSREAGLVLLGDVIEASCRTLSNPTPSRIRNLVRDRIERVFMDGQLDECELTLRDLNKIAESFNRILNGIFHHRIDYPEPVIREFNGGRKENNGDIDRKSAEKNRRKSSAGTTVPE
jgi:putative nucleotidyltransferase with HDIG domain